jgi:cell division protein DivIC
MPHWFSRFFLLSLLLAAVLGTVWALTYLHSSRQELARLQRVETETSRRLAEAERRLVEQGEILERLRNDPAYVEAVIRRRLGLAKPDEFVFRFEDQ